MATGDASDTNYQINDPEELSQTHRINELLKRRSEVIDARDEAFDVQLLGEASKEEALLYYRSRIESLILDLWTKFQSDEIDGGEKYLKKEKIDTVRVPPPRKLRDLELAPGAELPDPKPVHIRGLQWFIKNNGTIEREFSALTWDPPGEQIVTNEMLVPRETLDKALVACEEFMDLAGIDADLIDDGQDLIRNFDASGDNADDPHAESGSASFDGEPEI